MLPASPRAEDTTRCCFGVKLKNKQALIRPICPFLSLSFFFLGVFGEPEGRSVAIVAVASFRVKCEAVARVPRKAFVL